MMTEDYVSFETAKLLKEKGFKEFCFKCYGVAVLHNGADISFDEECELKDEGRENEIEYVEGGRLYDYGCNNRDKDAKAWAAPTLWVAMKWLREVHHWHIFVIPRWEDVEYMPGEWQDEMTGYQYVIVSVGEVNRKNEQPITKALTPESAYESAIKYRLENLI